MFVSQLFVYIGNLAKTYTIINTCNVHVHAQCMWEEAKCQIELIIKCDSLLCVHIYTTYWYDKEWFNLIIIKLLCVDDRYQLM